jgi:outer membrane protein OmpA-like peptidoglycan-associated protein
MPEVQYGRCKNRGRCSIADRNQAVIIPADGNCPQCAKPLSLDMSSRRFKLVPLIIILALLGAGGYFVYDNFFRPAPPPGPVGGPTSTTPNPNPRTGPTPPQPIDNTASSAPADPARAVTDPKYTLDNENEKARQDVIKRIDQMPNLTQDQKNKLYSSVDKASGMGCVLIVPFGEGRKTLSQSEGQILVNALQAPSLRKLTEEPTLVFVILGYTEKKGDPKANMKISIDRAENVLALMREKGGVANVMYAVGMGSAEILNKETASSNRLVEVWAVFP